MSFMVTNYLKRDILFFPYHNIFVCGRFYLPMTLFLYSKEIPQRIHPDVFCELVE